MAKFGEDIPEVITAEHAISSEARKQKGDGRSKVLRIDGGKLRGPKRVECRKEGKE